MTTTGKYWIGGYYQYLRNRDRDHRARLELNMSNSAFRPLLLFMISCCDIREAEDLFRTQHGTLVARCCVQFFVSWNDFAV